ncbi:putative disease resistance protein [Glycine max]|nr:putative disease resistance protein [Glycine max]
MDFDKLVGSASLYAFLQIVLDKLASTEVVNLIRGEKKLLQKLKTTLIKVSAVLDDAEKKQITDDSRVKDWLNDLKDAVYKADDLLDELSTKAVTQKQVSNCFSHFLNNKKMASKLEDIVDRLKCLLKLKENLGLKEVEMEKNSYWPDEKTIPTTSLEARHIYGRDKDKEAIINLLLEDTSDGKEVAVILIVGVGQHQENGIRELGGLLNLRGPLSIIQLENVTKSDEALKARIMDKKHINSLSLEWSERHNNSLDFQIEVDVLSKLQPHQDLVFLSISGYKGTRFPDWVGNFSYYNMTHLSLCNCNDCCMLPSLGQLPSLKDLYISCLNSVKIIGASLYKTEDCSFVKPFSSLESLTIHNMPCWEAWISFDLDAFPLLKDLEIGRCPNLRGGLPNHLPALESLTIKDCKLLVSSLPTAPALRRLKIRGSKKVRLHEIPILVESLEVEGSPMVTSMIEAISNIKPSCLQSLTLSDCSSAISFSGGGLPASLKSLNIWGLKKLEFPTQHKHELLESLEIYDSCDSLISLPLIIFPNLKRLVLVKCENMESLLVSLSESSNNLSYFEIRDCPNFVSFPREGLPAPNLIRFTVENCDKLNSLPEQMSTLLPKLQYLHIDNCSEIESFPEGGMPPNLRLVGIANCEKLLRGIAWPSMDMLTSLYVQGPCYGIKSFPKEGLLPPSLTSLHLFDFSSLETLDCEGLIHLTSLQELEINSCQKLENMAGERLPASLIKLSIHECPMLQERCHKKHKEIWPKISHIHGIVVGSRS